VMCLRRANVQDVPAITEIINRDATILSRSQHYVFDNLRDFVVAEKNGQIVGCASLHVLWENIAEIRALTVVAHEQGNGLYGELVDYLLDDGKAVGVRQVVALTQNPRLLVNLGFRLVDRNDVPQIVWKECINCVHFPDCMEKPVLFDLDDPIAADTGEVS